MPNAPRLDGLPLWLQITISIIFGMATLGVALRGYFKRDGQTADRRTGETAQILGASFADMGAIRHLSDVCVELCGHIERLDHTVAEQTFHDRNRNELLREANQRMRELREVAERWGDRRA